MLQMAGVGITPLYWPELAADPVVPYLRTVSAMSPGGNMGNIVFRPRTDIIRAYVNVHARTSNRDRHVALITHVGPRLKVK